MIRTRLQTSRILVALSAVAAFTACQDAAAPVSSPVSVPARADRAADGSVVTPSPSSPTTGPTERPASVATVVLDPGHNGGNAANKDIINRLVPDGRGRMKPCNTTGTATDDGYPEHEFTWDVTQRIQRLLTERGHQVILTRRNNTGVGPCVDERAALANKSGAKAVVSIHADGVIAPTSRGFHIAHSAPPLNDVQGGAGLRLATALRDGLREGGLAPANYIGQDGLSARDDLAGLSFATLPTALIECGNMRDPADAALLKSADQRQRLAESIARGIGSYLRS